MTYFKIVDIVENWDEIQLSYDAQPKEKLTCPDDMDELVDRFLQSIFGESEQEIEEIDETDAFSDGNARSFHDDIW